MKNCIRNALFNDTNRATKQINNDTIYGTFDQHSILLDIPEVDDCVRLLNKYYLNNELIEEESINCRNRILNNFHPSIVHNKLMKIIKSFLPDDKIKILENEKTNNVNKNGSKNSKKNVTFNIVN